MPTATQQAIILAKIRKFAKHEVSKYLKNVWIRKIRITFRLIENHLNIFQSVERATQVESVAPVLSAALNQAGEETCWSTFRSRMVLQSWWEADRTGWVGVYDAGVKLQLTGECIGLYVLQRQKISCDYKIGSSRTVLVLE